MTPVVASAGRADTARHMQPADAGTPDDTDEALMLADQREVFRHGIDEMRLQPVERRALGRGFLRDHIITDLAQ